MGRDEPRSTPNDPDCRRNMISSEKIDRACDIFEAAWRADGRPLDLAVLLEGWTGDDKVRLLHELIYIDLEFRCKNRPTSGRPTTSADAGAAPSSAASIGRPPRLDEYIARFPDLLSLQSLPAHVIAQEYRVRRLWGDCPSRDDFLARFGDRRGELEK